jgi:hypothetical protein
MNTIINLTQHTPTADQSAAGVYNLSDPAWEAVKDALTFADMPDKEEIRNRAEYIAQLSNMDAEDRDLQRPTHAMIGGAPFLMAALEKALFEAGIIPLYAFSRRESVEQAQADGTVRKVAVFRHIGFVEVV